MRYLVAWEGTTTFSPRISGTTTVEKVKPISYMGDIDDLTIKVREDVQQVKEVKFTNFLILAFSKFEDP